ncbi:MAG TPA: condensation domain-containing protein, partial [Streptosporangiaceae bacterium]
LPAAATSTAHPGTGPIPLTPLMRAMAARAGGTPLLGGRFAQWMALTVPPHLNPTALQNALSALITCHPILAARLAGEGQAARLVIPAAADAVPGSWVQRVDAAGLDEAALASVVRTQAREASARLDPGAGVMVQVVWLDAGPAEGRLVVAAHHLVVDGVSWRILLPDLAAAYQAATTGDTPVLEAVPVPFAAWAAVLATQDRAGEQAAWAAIVGEGEEPPVGDRPLDPTTDRAGTQQRVTVQIDPEVAEDLVARVPGMFHCGPDEVLLAGLAGALATWRSRRGQPHTSVLVDVETHGRQPLTAGMDLSRAVGWFTSTHPVRLDTGPAVLAEVRAGGPAAGHLLKAIKEQARAVPGDGLGYGLLRYGSAEDVLAGRPHAQVGFNYLGRFTTSGGGRGDGGGHWVPAGGLGGDVDPDMPVLHALEAGAIVRDTPAGPQLRLTLSWPEGLIQDTTARDLASEWAAMLTGLAEHAANPTAGGHTPSDFTLLGLDQDEVEELEAEFGADLATDEANREVE